MIFAVSFNPTYVDGAIHVKNFTLKSVYLPDMSIKPREFLWGNSEEIEQRNKPVV